MSIEVSFEIDVEHCARELSASWQAEQFERIAEIRSAIARLEAEEVRVLAGLLWQAEGEAGEDCFEAGDPEEVTRRHDLAVRSIATELAGTTRSSTRVAQQRLGEAWSLSNRLLGTMAALEAGEISRAHAHEILSETAHLTGGLMEAERLLLPWAKRLPPAQFRRKARSLLETLETEPLHDRHERAFVKRRVSVIGADDGMAHLEAYLDAADAAVVKAGLEHAARESRQAGDPRTALQLEADYLVELLLNGRVTIGTVGADGVGETATVRERAHVAVEVLIPAATLAGGNDQCASIPGLGVIDPVKARELVALAPSLRRILTDPFSGSVLDFDRKTYRVPASLKRILRLRDGHCRAPGCSAPLKLCELDHSKQFVRGGTTALINLAHLCENHHHQKDEGGWSLRQYADGVLEWRAPSGRHYRTYPENPFNGPPGISEAAPFDASPRGEGDER